MSLTKDLSEISKYFCFEGSFVDAHPIGYGHINDTYMVQCTNSRGEIKRYVLQCINHGVFHKPEGLMQNIERVTSHLRSKILAEGGNPERETLNLVPTVQGGSFIRNSGGEYWRAYLFIEGAYTYEVAESPQHVYHAAWGFGNFQRQLTDFPAEQLFETIPDFHHTPRRYEAFQAALQLDPFKRTSGIKPEIDFLLDRKPKTSVLVELIQQNRIPIRVTHNDTKFNNVMIDDHLGKSICIIDLDTVMPGTALYDFGDAVRSAAALSVEDEPDISKAGVSLSTFDNLVHGYLDAAHSFLTDLEIDYLAFSAQLITLEQAMRFLTDYLNGDIYYKIHRPGQNLDRARTQMRMVADMEEKSDQMEAIVAKYRKSYLHTDVTT